MDQNTDNQFKDPSLYVKVFRILAVLKFLFLAFYCLQYKQPIISLIPIIASISYVVMFINENTLLFARYTDWVLTTAIILFYLLYNAKVDINEIIFLVSLNCIMMLSGLFGRLEKSHTNRLIWFTIGCALFVPIFKKLVQIYRNKDGNKENKTNSLLTLSIWLIYPIIWLLAEEQHISIDTENSLVPMLDVTAKSGFCYLVLKENGNITWVDKIGNFFKKKLFKSV